MRVLYVEDDARDANLACRALERSAPRIAVDVVTTLADAAARLAAPNDYDLVLADLRLPDGTGLDLLAEIRRRALPHAVVILTGQGDETTAVAALKAGADDYLSKRAGYLDRLPAVLESSLDRFRSEAARQDSGLRVLYAEHHRADIDLTRRHLEAHAAHIRLSVVNTARELLAHLPATTGEQCAWDVLLLDYRLPGMNALEVLKTLHDERCVHVPVVLVTGQGDEEAAAQALRLGASDYLVKHANYLFALPATLENAHQRARLAHERAALQEATAELEGYFTTALDLFCIAGTDGVFRRLNRQWEAALGYPLEELIGRRFLDFVHPDDQEATRQAVSRLEKQEQVVDFVNRYRHKDGSYRWIEWRSTPAGPLIYAAARDVTQRRQTELVLREAQERLQRAASAGRVGLWDADLRTGVVVRSAEWKRQLGYEEHELADTMEEWQSRLHPEDLEQATHDQRVSLAPPWPPYKSEFRLRHRDGTYRRILAQGSLLFDERGEPARMFGTHLDITERTLLETQLRQARKMESVGRLAGGVAHDFNNLLTVINSAAELAVMQTREDDPLRRELEEIRDAAKRAAALTRQLLAFSRKQVLRPVVLDLNALIASTEKMLRRLIGEDVDLVFRPAERLGAVRADPGQTEQVIVNLAVNARDAMPSGGKLTIETADVDVDEAHARSHADSQPGPHVMLAVSDTGTGMDAGTLERAFEPFFTTKEAGRGTGLGLSTVYGIVRQSGGHISVQSEVGAGTTVRVYLPRAEGAAQTAEAAPPEEPARGTETVLLVEDDQALRVLATRVLGSAGFTVVAAADPEEAERVLLGHQGPLHLLLTDVVLPGRSGREMAQRLTEMRPGLKVLFMSGYADDTILHRGVLDRGVQFIAKPFTGAALVRKVREVLDAAG